MASTGATLCGSGTASAPPGSGAAWQNPGNILTDNNAVATLAHLNNGESGHLIASQFGFSISASAITGITVTAGVSFSNTLVQEEQAITLRLRNSAGTLVGTSKIYLVTSITPNVEELMTVGGSADTWGASLTQSDINSSAFGVELWVESVGYVWTLNVDYVKIDVTYTAGGTTHTASATLNAVATPSTSGLRLAVASVAATAFATGAIAGSITANASSTATAFANTSSSAVRVQNASTTQSALATSASTGNAALSGQSTFNAIANASGTEGAIVANATAIASAVATANSNAIRVQNADASVFGLAISNSNAIRFQNADTFATAFAVDTTTGNAIVSATSIANAIATLDASAIRYQNAETTVSAFATVTADGDVSSNATASLSAIALATVDALRTAIGQSNLSAFATTNTSGVVGLPNQTQIFAYATSNASGFLIATGQSSISAFAIATTPIDAVRVAAGSTSPTAFANITANASMNSGGQTAVNATATATATPQNIVGASADLYAFSTVAITGSVNKYGDSALVAVATTSTAAFTQIGASSNLTAIATPYVIGYVLGQVSGNANLQQDDNNATLLGETCEVGVVILRTETLQGSGSFQSRSKCTIWAGLQYPEPDWPWWNIDSAGTATLPFVQFSWHNIAPESNPTNQLSDPITFDVGCYAEINSPYGNNFCQKTVSFTASSGGTNPVQAEVNYGGLWSASIEAQLCMQIVSTGDFGTGASYKQDPPHGQSVRFFWRTKANGNYSFTISIDTSAVATVSGVFPTAVEFPYPDKITLANSLTGGVSNSISGSGNYSTSSNMVGSWRGGTTEIANPIVSSGPHGTANANASGASTSINLAPTGIIGSDNAEASAFLSVATPLSYTLDARRMSMESDYQDSASDFYTRGNETVSTGNFTSYFSDSRTLRWESASTRVATGATVEDEDTYSTPNQFGPISMRETGNDRLDRYYLIKDRRMNAISINVPALTGDLTGVDTAVTGGPYGVLRDYTTAAPYWRGLMGYRYLEVIIAESGGNPSGQAITITIERIGLNAPINKTFVVDKNGNDLLSPGGGNSATYVLDLCSPSNSGLSDADATDTTYPYTEDWTPSGGNEDSFPRGGEGPWTGCLYASKIRITTGVNRTFTITSIKGKRESLPVYVTNLPSQGGTWDAGWWKEQRPPTEVANNEGQPTNTEHRIRQCFMIDHDGRLLTAEWSDCTWDRTVGGVSGVVTNSFSQNSIEWLAARINANRLLPGWTATIGAPPLGSSGVECYYNRQRRMVELCGSGTWWEAPSITYPNGRWREGIDLEFLNDTPGEGQLVIPWQGGFDEILQCPGKVGDVFLHKDGQNLSPLTIKLAQIRRFQGVGMALDDAGLPVADAKLVLTQLVGGVSTNKGEGLSNARGYAQTGQPYGKTTDDAFELGFEGGPTSSYDPKVRRKRYHFRSRIIRTGGDFVCLYRHGHDRAYFYWVKPSTGLVVWDYSGQPSDPNTGFAKVETVIDSSTECKMPTAWLHKAEFHEVVYLRGKQPYYGRSTQSSRNWTLTTIPGNADAITACHHNERLIVAQYHDNRWYVRVGRFDRLSNAYLWSGEEPILAANAAKPHAHLYTRSDNVIEFAYLNASGEPRVIRTHSLSTNAIGTWA